MSTGFGARPDGGAFHSRQEQDIQALKLRLHRYIIDEIDEDGMNLLEGARSAVVQYVSEKVCEYGSRHQLAISRYELDRLAEEVVDELTGFGPLEILLRDPGVSEILVNGPGRVFVEREGRLYQSDLRFIDDHHVLRVIQRILAPLGRRLDESSPMVDARLPDGSRVNAIIPPVALDGPCISIRKFSQEAAAQCRPAGLPERRRSLARVPPPGGLAPLQHPHQWRHRHRQDHLAQRHQRLHRRTRADRHHRGHRRACNSATTTWCVWRPVRRTPRATAR